MRRAITRSRSSLAPAHVPVERHRARAKPFRHGPHRQPVDAPLVEDVGRARRRSDSRVSEDRGRLRGDLADLGGLTCDQRTASVRSTQVRTMYASGTRSTDDGCRAGQSWWRAGCSPHTGSDTRWGGCRRSDSASFQGVSGRSWALTAVLGDGGARMFSGVLIIVPMVGLRACGRRPGHGPAVVASGGGRIGSDLAAGDARSTRRRSRRARRSVRSW